MLLDQIAEAAVIIEAEGGAADPDDIDVRADIPHYVVGRGGDAEGADARWRALSKRAKQRTKFADLGLEEALAGSLTKS